jgi:hypothetical protein
MSTVSGDDASRERTSSYLYFGSLYFFVVGVLYLWGYWPTFGINVLEYMNLTDVLKLTAYPLVSSFIFAAIGVIVGELVGFQQAVPPGFGRNTQVGRFLNRHAPFLAAVYTLAALALLAYGPATKWLVLPTLAAIPIALAAKRGGMLASLLPNDSARTVVIFLLALLPAFAYGRGRYDAAAVLDGTDYQYLAAGTVEGLTLLDPNNPKNRVKYLGQVNDYVFLLLPDNATSVVVRFDKTHTLQLRRFRAGATDIAP